MANTDIDHFAEDVVKLMKEYTIDVEEAINEEVERCGNVGAKKLQAILMPEGTSADNGRVQANEFPRRLWTEYSKHWVNKYDAERNYTSSTIHNKKHYSLTHLLEYGHATLDGKTTRAFPHIDKINEEMSKELLDNVMKIVEKGGKL